MEKVNERWHELMNSAASVTCDIQKQLAITAYTFSHPFTPHTMSQTYYTSCCQQWNDQLILQYASLQLTMGNYNQIKTKMETTVS